MKIKITSVLPVAPEICPEIGSIHEVTREGKVPASNLPIYFIKIGRAQVGVLSEECEVIGE